MIVVVGGHTRNIGKTSVAAGLIRRLPEYAWTALKITQYGHSVCTHGGHGCHCGPDPAHPYALSEEYEPGTRDSARFLEAGARRAFWLRTAVGELHRASPAIQKILSAGGNTIIESNSILELLRPDIYLMVLDFARNDFKQSASRFLERADAFVMIEGNPTPPGVWDTKPQFPVRPPDYVSDALAGFVRSES